MNDDWVLNKHVQMLTNAGIDYLIFDTTNAVTYDMTAKRLLKVLNKYYQAGYTNVPKIAYYTNSSSGTTINHIYTNIYMRYPEYSHLWFMWDGKPLIIGHPDDPKLSKEAKDYFRIKVCYWPTEKRSSDDQWPWIEFGGIYTDEAIYGLDGRKEVINVSSAQHCSNVFSASAFYGAENRTKSYNWFKQKNEDDPDAYLYGNNFKDQWEWAIEKDPETIFVTQWNEWIAMRLEPLGGNPIVFVDSADPNNCRDIEPMRGGYGDNYYMQLCEYVRKFKGQEPVPVTEDKITIDIKGSFDQWAEVYTTYTDYIDEIPNRKIRSFGGVLQEDTSGRNDFSIMKLANDKDFYYFYVETTKDITSPDKNWMTLFINSLRGKKSWESFDLVVNRLKPKDNFVSIEKSLGNWNWEEVAWAEYKIEGNKMMLAIPKDVLDVGSFQFKWADNYLDDDIYSFYTHGDAAPLGRLTYIFKNEESINRKELKANKISNYILYTGSGLLGLALLWLIYTLIKIKMSTSSVFSVNATKKYKMQGESL